jgi:hypothetical protein
MKRPIKMLLVGDSKAGKTGALASLVLAGYHVRVIDLDNGTDIILGVPAVKQQRASYSEDGASWSMTLRNGGSLDIQTCTDGMIQVKKTTIVQGKSVEGFQLAPDGTAWDKALVQFHHWPKYGPVETWDTDTVLVIDSLSFLSQAALNWVLKLNGRLGTKAFDTDIGDTQNLIRGVLGTLFNTELRCNVIVITHLDYRGGSLFKEGSDRPNRPAPKPDHNDLVAFEKAYPMTIGKAMNNTVGRYFNTLFLVKTIGSGDGTRRVICTRNTNIGTAQIDLASIDLDTPAQLPIETGLADYFRIVKGNLLETKP